MKKVFVGAPVRNRGWVLPRHLDALLLQNVGMQFCYVVNDCEDDTEYILQKYGIRYVKKNLNATHSHLRGHYSYKSLSLLRNTLLEEFLKSDCDYLFSIDTDIVIPKDSLKVLLEDDKDIVSMLIKNHPTLDAHNVMNNGVSIPSSLINKDILPVDLTGAVYLIKREVIEAGVRYGYHWQGEDVPFCETAKEKGFEIYCDTRLRPIHAYDERTNLIAEMGIWEIK